MIAQTGNRTNCRRLIALLLLASVTTGYSALAQSVIVDNVDSGFSILSGTWETGSYPTPYGSDYNWALTTGYDPEEPAAEVEWRPAIPQDGYYEVAVWYVEGTNRADNATYTVHHADGTTPVPVDQKSDGSTWQALGTFRFDTGSTGYVTLDNNAHANVVIADAVRFSLVETMVQVNFAAFPSQRGTVTPAPGTYFYPAGQVISISAIPAEGSQLDHWVATAGDVPANIYAENTTVVADENKTVAAIFVEEGPMEQFRAFWADAFGVGFKSTSQIDDMISRAVAGNYNAIIPEVLAHQDTGATGHGAYWDSDIVPMASDISGGIDPLAYLVQQAHANGLEVHPWLVAFRICSSWPPNGNTLVANHPEWVMVPRESIGLGPVPYGSGTSVYYNFDPGSPDVQEYLMSIVRELCTNYAIDGIHWDYIRYTQTNAGYPADLNYDKSSLARFHDVTGRSDVPSTSDTEWNDFRRRTITEVVRRAMHEVATADNERQPLRHTAALVTWSPASSNFHLTSPYAVFSDWEYWQSMGYLDATIPMCYFEEQSYSATYRSWVDNAVAWANQYNRHTYIGPGIYLNLLNDSATQIDYALGAGAHGITTYSYRSTNDDPVPWSDWYPYVATEVFTEPAGMPSMSWRNPGTAMEGTVYGRVADGASGNPIDNALIYVDGQSTGIRTDGNGDFILTRLDSGSSGVTHSIRASVSGMTPFERPAVLVTPAGFTEANLAVGSWKFGDRDVNGEVDLDDYAHLAGCLTGPENGPPAAGCDLFDADADGDVDLRDVREFQDGFGS